MKILFITPVTIDSCSFYRTGGIAPDLSEKLKIHIDVTSWDKERFHWQNIIKYNLIMMQRPYTESHYSMAKYAKEELGIPIWLDYDDLLLSVPVSNKAHETMNEARAVIEKVIAVADVVTVTTQELRIELLKFNKNVQIIPNAHNDYIFRRREVLSERQKIIAWRGSDTHFADIMLMAESLIRNISKYTDWSFPFLGFNPWFLGAHKNLVPVKAMDPILYFRNIVKLAPHVFHVPLVPSLFNRCKSNIAALEATYSGSLCIAPDWSHWRIPGILNYKDEKSYSDLMEAVIRGEINVKENADLAWEYIADNMMLSKVNRLRADLVNKLLNL